MRVTAASALAGSGLLLGLAGCGLVGGGNSDQVCADTKQAFQQYMTRVKGISAAAPAQWKAETERLAGELEALAKKADEGELKKALKGEAGRLRSAAGPVGTGDTAQLNAVMAQTPEKIGKACS